MSTIMFKNLDDVELGNGVRIMRGDILKESSALSTGSEVLDSRVVRLTGISNYPLTPNNHFFVSWHSGFAGNFYGNYSVLDHLDRLRAFSGCWLALRILEDDFVDNEVTQSGILVHDVTDGPVGPLVLTSRTDSDISTFYENFDLGGDYQIYDFGDDDEEVDDNGELSVDKVQQRDKVLELTKIAFGSDDHNRRLFTSCLWLFRASTSSRPMDQILYSTISLEVLLGDRETADRIGLTKLLANRCAYLLGESRSERDKMMEQFKEIYDIRSQIVHAGLHQTGREVDKASTRSRELAARVIRKELTLAKQ